VCRNLWGGTGRSQTAVSLKMALAHDYRQDRTHHTNWEERMITGSSRGIGRGIALKLAECGVHRIGVHYLKNRAAVDDTADKLRERGADPVVIQADVTKWMTFGGCLRRCARALVISMFSPAMLARI
jgi:hypothetical protein